jgi:hypothetical protein
MSVFAIDALMKIRWGDYVRCCYCWGLNPTLVGSSKWPQYKCYYCNSSFSVISKTAFEKTNLTPEQIRRIVVLHAEGQINLKPFRLAKKIGTYSEKIKKVVEQIKDLSPYELMNVPQIVVFETLLKDLKSDVEFMPFFRLMYMYKIMNVIDEKALSNISGLNISSVQVALFRINNYWSHDTAFEEDEGFNWHKWDDWSGEILKPLTTIHLHAMCLAGIIMRDPSTRMYYIGR